MNNICKISIFTSIIIHLDITASDRWKHSLISARVLSWAFLVNLYNEFLVFYQNWLMYLGVGTCIVWFILISLYVILMAFCSDPITPVKVLIRVCLWLGQMQLKSTFLVGDQHLFVFKRDLVFVAINWLRWRIGIFLFWYWMIVSSFHFFYIFFIFHHLLFLVTF